MARQYGFSAIADSMVPRAMSPLLQHLLDTYASETKKVISVWREFSDADLTFRLHPRSNSDVQIFEHQFLSERGFFAQFLGLPEPVPPDVLPPDKPAEALARRMLDLALPRLSRLARKEESWWLEPVRFFDVTRERIWIFWRRVLDTAHHRTQLTLYLRLMDKVVPPTYGPRADVMTRQGADPALNVDAAARS